MNFIAILSNFQQQNPLRKQYLPHLSSENCEIKFIKSDLGRISINTKNAPKFNIVFSFDFI
jgi:hypothetical protein